MIYRDSFRILSDEEKAQYKFDFCELCEFYECELVGEYEQYKKSHNRCFKSQISESKSRLVLNVTATPLKENKNFQNSDSVINVKAVPLDKGNVISEFNRVPTVSYHSSSFEESESGTDVLSYDQSKLKDRCFMSFRHVYQVECGRQRVTEGIGEHFKVEINGYDGTIKENTTDRWEPSQPVFISAQTGQGKNFFIENTLIPYVKKLDHDNKTKQKVLILSNRLALKQQVKNRLNGNSDSDAENEEVYHPYDEYADVMTYQSILRRKKELEHTQRDAHARYIFVICDEAHFFTSDAMFNPHTQEILSTIISMFQNAVRVYMSATPYECLEYIIKYENERQNTLNSGKPQDKWKGEMMVFYHFKRNYSYLDVKTYSFMEELYDEIVESVCRRREKWLIFIDDKEKCSKVKAELEKTANNKKGCSLVIEGDGENKKVEKVFAVDADSKKNPTYQEIVNKERLNKDTYVLISTSVLDYGVNLTGINNIIVSDMSKVKCLQMVGRARVSDINDRKTLYLKRFNADEVDKQIENLGKQQDAYHSYELAYDELGRPRDCSDTYRFFEKYYNGSEKDWKDAKHWFGRPIDKPLNLYLNKIAKSLVDDKLISQYRFIKNEMIEESSKDGTSQGQKGTICTGQKYLEHQLSWFGKIYCEEDDITFADKEKAKKDIIAFFEGYIVDNREMDKNDQKIFRTKFTELSDAVFGRKDPNKERIYSITKINSILEEESINYRVVSRSSYWVVEKYNWEIEDSE